MGDTTQLEAVLVENLPLIDRIAAALARRNGLAGDDASDFASWVKLKLVEDDFAVVRKFRGESALSTYLTVVVAMLARDYRVQRFGRWRSSAAARQNGPVAVKLESLVRRQGYRLEHAGELLRTSGQTALTDRELSALLARCPMRGPMRPLSVGEQPLASAESDTSADVLVVNDEIELRRQRAWGALSESIQAFPSEDRLVLRMKFWDEMSVADIARALSIEQKSLYRRLERLLAELKRRLASAGITGAEWSELVAEADA